MLFADEHNSLGIDAATLNSFIGALTMLAIAGTAALNEWRARRAEAQRKRVEATLAEVKTLTNGAMGAQLQQHADTTERLAALTQRPADEIAAENARKKAEEHRQAEERAGRIAAALAAQGQSPLRAPPINPPPSAPPEAAP